MFQCSGDVPGVLSMGAPQKQPAGFLGSPCGTQSSIFWSEREKLGFLPSAWYGIEGLAFGKGCWLSTKKVIWQNDTTNMAGWILQAGNTLELGERGRVNDTLSHKPISRKGQPSVSKGERILALKSTWNLSTALNDKRCRAQKPWSDQQMSIPLWDPSQRRRLSELCWWHPW